MVRALSLCLPLLCWGCFAYETEALPQGPGGEPADPAGEPEPAGETGDFVDPEYAPPEAHAACEQVAPIDGAFTPHALCDYVVEHPTGITDVRPSCGAANDPPTGLHLTFPEADPSRTVAITWTTADTTRVSEVRVGTDPEQLDRVYRGHSFGYVSLVGRVIHEVHLCGLRPGRTYYYRAGGEGAWSEVASFTTAPARGSDEPIIIGVTGDSRSSTGEYELWAEACRRMAAAGVDLMLFSGDAVELGLVQAQWDGWFEKGQPYLASIPIIPANGNHDFIAVHWLAQFALPRNEENFAYRYGDVLIVAMADTPQHDGGAVFGRAKRFLDEALTAHADATWKIVVNHRPFYSASTRHGSSLQLQEAWLPIIEKHRVDLVFNGHDHNYERSRPIRGGEVVAPGEGTVYVVAAGVGAPLYDNGVQWWTEKSEKVASYVVLEIDGPRIDAVAHRIDGTELDRFGLQK